MQDEVEAEAKKELCKKIYRMLGYSNPPGLNDLLSILKHPDVIELTKKWLAL